jgi:hypothetical protein
MTSNMIMVMKIPFHFLQRLYHRSQVSADGEGNEAEGEEEEVLGRETVETLLLRPFKYLFIWGYRKVTSSGVIWCHLRSMLVVRLSFRSSSAAASD